MLKKLFKRKKTQNTQVNIIDTNTTEENKEPSCEINISKNDEYYTITVNTYASINDFINNDELILISNNISWNNEHQKHNYGTYYIIKNNNEIYNILINDKIIKIDERIQFETYTHEKIITYDIKKNTFDYFQCKHDIHGSSYKTEYYNSEENGFFIKELELSKENTIIEINSIFNNLNKYNFIYKIFDIDNFFKTLNEILTKKIELTLK